MSTKHVNYHKIISFFFIYSTSNHNHHSSRGRHNKFTEFLIDPFFNISKVTNQFAFFVKGAQKYCLKTINCLNFQTVNDNIDTFLQKFVIDTSASKTSWKIFWISEQSSTLVVILLRHIPSYHAIGWSIQSARLFRMQYLLT